MKQTYTTWAPQAKLQPLLAKAIQITTDYLEKGLTLTLRQLFYRMVAANLITNDHDSYKRLGRMIVNARNAGLLDWDAIEDRTRGLVAYASWDDPAAMAATAAEQYANDLWATQPKRVEVWIEKDALVGVIEPACREWRVPIFSCRGYASVTEMRKAGTRIAGYAEMNQDPIVLYLGDHDPSGMQMRDNVENSLARYARLGWAGHGEVAVDVERLALNIDQVEELDLPPNKIKETDTRGPAYQAEFGDESWELDALDPDILDEIVRDAIADNLDTESWRGAVEAQEAGRQQLTAFVTQLNGKG